MNRPHWKISAFAFIFAALLLVLRNEPTIVGQQADAVNVKMSGVLADLSTAVQQTPPSLIGNSASASLASMPKSVQDGVHGRRLRISAAGEVQVYVLLSAYTDDNRDALVAAGATIEIVDAARRRVQARVPVSRLQTVAALPFVTFVRPPTYARFHTGSIASEGDAILNADVTRQQFSVDGTGVRIGVISDGLKGLFATGCTTCSGVAGGPIATGNLPNATGTRTPAGILTSASGGITGQSFQANNDLEGLPPASPACGFSGAGGEGTALLEIVHDLAPGAQLSFANGDTDMAFMQAVNALAATNDVVVDDVGFFGEAYDGTSGVSSNTANALNNPSNAIRAYVTSVGNNADNHYFGAYSDSGIDGSTISGIARPGRLHRFQPTSDTTDAMALGSQPYDLIFLPRSGEVVIFLTWDDPSGASSNNYDLYLVQQGTGRVVARSIDTQNGGQDPVEALDFVNTGADDYFRILVQNVNNSAQPRRLNMYSFQPECALDGPRVLAPPRHDLHNFNTISRSIAAQGDAGGSPAAVLAVGAICSGSFAAASRYPASLPNDSCNDRNHVVAEYFSSRGPTLDGRMKPDIAAIDGVSVSGAGSFPNPFFGTSAAAPHVAAIAGLALQAAPCLLASGGIDAATARLRVRDLLTSAALPLSGVPDNTFGAGRADAFATLQKTLPILKAAQVTVSGNTASGASLSASDLGFSDPSLCSVTKMSWTGGCGTSPGSRLNCPFGTTKISVQGSNNGVTFSPASDLQITVTNFSIGVSPSAVVVPAGQPATYSATVNAQGGAFGTPVTLTCTNLPAGTSCTFNPPTLMPGTGSVSSTLTITTTARPNSSNLPGMPTARLAALIATLLLWGTGLGRSRRKTGFIAVSAVVSCLFVQPACGGGGGSTSSSSPPSSTSPGVAGVAIAPPAITFTAQPAQTTSAPQTVTITNSGTAALIVSAIAISGEYAQTNNCPGTLAGGAGCSVAVTFTPTAAGTRAGALTITDNASGSPHTVALSGIGQVANAGPSGPTPAGAYSLGVAGQSGALAQSTSVTLIVQ